MYKSEMGWGDIYIKARTLKKLWFTLTNFIKLTESELMSDTEFWSQINQDFVPHKETCNFESLHSKKGISPVHRGHSTLNTNEKIDLVATDFFLKIKLN